MGINHRNPENAVSLAVPMLDVAGNVEGWFRFEDVYLSPEVQYTSFPPTTRMKFGGRYIEMDRAVPVKIRLLEEDEDYHFWCKKRQHSQRINCGEYHKDFGDVEIGYSFSSPQTHIWFAGYAIHTDCFENVFLNSHNATIRVTPEHIIPKQISEGMVRSYAQQSLFGRKKGLEKKEAPGVVSLGDLVPTRSLFEMVVEEGADFPIYTAAIPRRVETHKGYITEMVPTAEFINDCERDIIKRDAWDAGAAVAQLSDPVSYPPTFPPVQPFEHSKLFWSFIFNKLLEKRLARDELEQAFKDIVLVNRFAQYSKEVRRSDLQYSQALDRLAGLFASKDVIHNATWPARPQYCEGCRCVLCRAHHRHRGPEPPLQEIHFPPEHYYHECHRCRHRQSAHRPRVKEHKEHHRKKGTKHRRKATRADSDDYTSSSGEHSRRRRAKEVERAHKALSNVWQAPPAQYAPPHQVAEVFPTTLPTYTPLYFAPGGIRPNDLTGISLIPPTSQAQNFHPVALR